MTRRTRRIGRVGITAVAVVAVVMGAALAGVLARASSGDRSSESATTTTLPTSFETVAIRRGSLSSEREFNGQVSYGDTWDLPTTASGTVTASLPAGTVIDFGEPIVVVDNQPVLLVRGDVPLYRTLELVNTSGRDEFGNRLTLQTGDDVRQLQSFLLELGYDDDGRLDVDGEFGKVTQRAVKAWQEATGLPVSGAVDGKHVVFEPSPIRLDAELRVGSAFSGLEVSAPNSLVIVDTSTRDRSAISVGTNVEIEGDDERALGGTVIEQVRRLSDDGSTIWRTSIEPTVPLPDGAATAVVRVNQSVADDVLLAPVACLLALSEGGYAVEMPAGSSTEFVRVEVGTVLDGTAEISGEIGEGDLVLVPA